MKKNYFTTLLISLILIPFLGMSQNLVTNAGFENWTGDTPDNWTYESGVIFTQESTNIHSGTYSAMVTLTTQAQGDTDTQNASAAVIAGEPFNSSVWVYDNDPAGRVSLVLYWDGGPANTYSGIYSEDMDAWQELVFDDFVPEGATGVKVGFRFYDVSDNWDGDAVFYVDDYSFEINTTVYPEPTNYPTNFIAEPSSTKIITTWTDAAGEQLPLGYLVLGNNDGSEFLPPVDGTPVDNDLNWDDGMIAMNVLFDVETFSVSVDPNTEYTFTIYPYSNTGENIDYKTDGTPPTATATSSNSVTVNQEGFDTDLGTWTGYSVVGEQVWVWDDFGVPPGCAKMNGYDGGPIPNEDWLISPSLDLENFETVSFSFDHARNWASNDGLYVLVSTDYDGTSDPSTNGTWNDLTSMFTFPDPGSWDFIPAGDEDVTTYTGASTYFAFKYTSTDSDASTWEVDNALVYGVLGVGVPENETSTLRFYPNPANELINFTAEISGHLSIVNLAGQLILSKSIQKGENSIDVSALEMGMYVLQYVDHENHITVEKLMVR